MFKQIAIYFVLLITILCLAGCKSVKEDPDPSTLANTYSVYYGNQAGTKLISRNYQAEQQEPMKLVEELMSQLKMTPEEGELKSLIPESVTLSAADSKIENALLHLDLKNYLGMTSSVDEILCRAAIVKTLSQVITIDHIIFSSGGQPVLDGEGNPISMSVADFSEQSAEMVNEYKRAVLKLYFANEAGDKLVETSLEVLYTNDKSVEQLIVETLIKGPSQANIYPTLPEKTKVLKVWVTDNICYVKLDSGFIANQQKVSDYIPIYSIVNSLSELSTVNKVNIMISGEKEDYLFRDLIPLGKPFERNLDYVGEE